MASTRKTLLTYIHTILSGRANGTLVQDTDHELAEQRIVNYAALASSPYNGLLWPELGEAIRFFGVSDLQPGQLFFINRVYAHKPVTGGYQYYVEVALAWNSFTINCVAMTFDVTVSTLKSGVQTIGLSEYDGSGAQGYMVINWDALINIGSGGYGCTDYKEGALIPTLVSAGYWKGIGSIATDMKPPMVAEDFEADGIIPLIYCNPASVETITCNIKTWDLVKGPFCLKNVGWGDVRLVSADAYTIDGSIDGLIHSHADATIRKYDDPEDPRYFTTGGFNPTEA